MGGDSRPKVIFCEHPEKEQWRMLLKFSYPSNIEKFLVESDHHDYDEKLGASIAGALLQAYEYFKANEVVSLTISPVLLYYGVTNLLYGILSLKEGHGLDIRKHGLDIVRRGEFNQNGEDSQGRLGDTEIIVSSDSFGAFHVYNSLLASPDFQYHSSRWKLSEMFRSLPDMVADVDGFYQGQPSYCLPVEIIKNNDTVIERIEKSYVDKYTEFNAFERIAGFGKCYLSPGASGDYFILRKRLGFQEIGIHSLAGQKFLVISHIKDNTQVTLPVVSYMLIGLFALCSLSRYAPDYWFDFIQNDRTGERLLVENFISICRRYLPNLMLNHLYDRRIVFNSKEQGVIDLSNKFTAEDITQIIQRELRKLND